MNPSLDEALIMLAEKKELLRERITTLKILGDSYTDIAKKIKRSTTAVYDFMAANRNRYDWSYTRIVEALRKLEAHDD